MVEAVLLLALAAGPQARSFHGSVIGVADGDTITVLGDRQQIRIRLDGINCPEGGQAFSNRAKQFTSALVFAKTVTISPRDVDRYGRTVARVYVDDKDVSLRFRIRYVIRHRILRYQYQFLLLIQYQSRCRSRAPMTFSRTARPSNGSERRSTTRRRRLDCLTIRKNGS